MSFWRWPIRWIGDVVLVCGLLVACGVRELLPVPPMPPAPVASCPPPVLEPALLPVIVTTERLQAAYRQLELARLAERARADTCARGLARLQAYIETR